MENLFLECYNRDHEVVFLFLLVFYILYIFFFQFFLVISILQ